MGSRGPIPKRDAERRRQNKPDVPTETVKVTGAVRVPAAESGWHPIAKRWYRSLKTSGQAKFYEPSDWMTAKYTAELMSRLLNQGERPSAQMVASLNSLMASLLVTEGDRRRARMEVERLGGRPLASVTTMDAYRRARSG
jgi:cytochrome oxidase assembly protein ShyY1